MSSFMKAAAFYSFPNRSYVRQLYFNNIYRDNVRLIKIFQPNSPSLLKLYKIQLGEKTKFLTSFLYSIWTEELGQLIIKPTGTLITSQSKCIYMITPAAH